MDSYKYSHIICLIKKPEAKLKNYIATVTLTFAPIPLEESSSTIKDTYAQLTVQWK